MKYPDNNGPRAEQRCHRTASRQSKLSITMLWLVCCGVPSVWAQVDSSTIRGSVVQIAVGDGETVTRLGTGFAVGEGFVLTAAHLVEDSAQVLVYPVATESELTAHIVYSDDNSDVALLAVVGLTLPPLTFARDGFELGRRVVATGVWGPAGSPVFLPDTDGERPLMLAEGTVERMEEHHLERSITLTLIEHSAAIPTLGYGGPLFNECGEVVGVNRSAPGAVGRQESSGQGPEGVRYSLPTVPLVSVLQSQGLNVSESQTRCVSSIEQTQQDLEEVATAAAEAQARVSDLEERYQTAIRTGASARDELHAELEAAHRQEEAARNEATSLETQVAALRERLDGEVATDDASRIVIAIAVAFVGLVGVAIFIGYRKRSHQPIEAQHKAVRAQLEITGRDRATEPALPSCVIAGSTSDDRPIAIKIPGALLGKKGVVIGRSPRSATFVIDDTTLSRRHARLFGKDDDLLIEDLGATNGTRVNGRELGPRRPTPIRHGDRIEFGAVKLELAVGD